MEEYSRLPPPQINKPNNNNSYASIHIVNYSASSSFFPHRDISHIRQKASREKKPGKNKSNSYPICTSYHLTSSIRSSPFCTCLLPIPIYLSVFVFLFFSSTSPVPYPYSSNEKNNIATKLSSISDFLGRL